jgi:hypothetical protein
MLPIVILTEASGNARGEEEPALSFAEGISDSVA